MENETDGEGGGDVVVYEWIACCLATEGPTSTGEKYCYMLGDQHIFSSELLIFFKAEKSLLTVQMQPVARQLCCGSLFFWPTRYE